MRERKAPLRMQLVGIFSISFAVSVTAQPQLTFAVTSHIESPKGVQPALDKSAAPSDASYPLTVVLAHQYLSIEFKGERTIYDFANARWLELNLAAKSYENHSLYARAAFNAMEFQNRQMLGKMLQAGKLNSSPMDPVLVEHLFSQRNPELKTHLERQDARGQSTFLWQQQTLASFSEKTRQLPTGFQTDYWRFLRYFVGGHPEIYAALAGVDGVPEQVTFVLHNMQVETRTMALRAITNVPDAAFSVAGFTLTMPSDSPYPTLALLDSYTPNDLQTRVREVRLQRQAFVDQGRVFDAVLAQMADLIMTGDSAEMTTWAHQNVQAIQGDANARALMASLRSQDKEAAKAAVDTIGALHRADQPYGYVLDVFEGNTRLGLGDKARGTEQLLSALAANPLLLGAWKDLGADYDGTFETNRAWDCWDAARKLDPEHPMFKPINQLEQKLRADFPEYF